MHLLKEYNNGAKQKNSLKNEFQTKGAAMEKAHSLVTTNLALALPNWS